jgi:DNA-binding GntR family transcriptional regulator
VNPTTPEDSLRVASQPKLRTLVADRLRAAIARNRFPPGARLKERELCELLGVSRTSIREALRELEGEGLVSTQAGRPTVAVLSTKQVNEIYQVRVALEGLAARLFARQATDAHLAELEQATRALEAVVANFEVGPFLSAKTRFYDALFEGAGNEVAASMLRAIHTKVSLLRATSLASATRSVQSIKEIRALVAALAARDEEAAYRLCVEHIENASRAAMAVLAQADEKQAQRA